MLFVDHIRYGFIASVVTTGAYSLIAPQIPELSNNPDSIAVAFGACLAGSLSPDLDTNSKPSKWVAMFGACFGLWALYNREPYFALAFLTAFSFIKTFNHRTYTHLYSLPLILCIVAVKQDIWWLIPFSVGLVCHYFCDCAGPRKLYPWDWHSWIIIPKIPRMLQ